MSTSLTSATGTRRTGLRRATVRTTPATRRHEADLATVRRLAAAAGVTVLDELDEGRSSTRVELARGSLRYSDVVTTRLGRTPRLARVLAAEPCPIPWTDRLPDSSPYTSNRARRVARDAVLAFGLESAAFADLPDRPDPVARATIRVLGEGEGRALSTHDEAVGVAVLLALLDGAPLEWALRRGAAAS